MTFSMGGKSTSRMSILVACNRKIDTSRSFVGVVYEPVNEFGNCSVWAHSPPREEGWLRHQ